MKPAELPSFEPYFDEAGRFIHPCRICGREAGRGYGVALREGELGAWFCAECDPTPPQPASQATTSTPSPPDLQEWIDPYGGYTKKDWAARDVANTEYQQRRRK
jgi:hypothetical protein